MKKESRLVENCIDALEYSPLCVMFALFDNIRKGKNGRIPVPQKGDKFLGNHVVTVYGYSREDRVFYFRNSWGKDWGNNGDGTLPFDYFKHKKWVPEIIAILITPK